MHPPDSTDGPTPERAAPHHGSSADVERLLTEDDEGTQTARRRLNRPSPIAVVALLALAAIAVLAILVAVPIASGFVAQALRVLLLFVALLFERT